MNEHPAPRSSGDVAAVEAAFLEARDALDRSDLTRGMDLDADVAALDAEAEALAEPVREALAACPRTSRWRGSWAGRPRPMRSWRRSSAAAASAEPKR